MNAERLVASAVLLAATLAALLPVKVSAETKDEIPPPPAIECNEYDHTLFLAQSNVILRNLKWRVPGTGQTGCGTAVPHLQDTGHFWFFDSQNLELTCKALDGGAINQKYWIFCGGLTDVEWWVDARSNANPELPWKSYYNPPGRMASFSDVNAIGQGANHAPYFVAARTECGRELTLFRSPNVSLRTSLFMQVRDPDGDALTAHVRVAEGDGTAVQIAPFWTNPIAGSAAPLYLAFDVVLPSVPGGYVLSLEVADGKSVLPSQCTVTLLVV